MKRAEPCEWCSTHHTGKCPYVKAIEYYPGGKIKRIEFMTPNDYPRLTSSFAGGVHVGPATAGTDVYSERHPR